jgi:uncharacterized protein (DUF111 family)
LVERRSLAREVHEVKTRFGTVRVKTAVLDGGVLRAMPEYDDCRQLAERTGVPLREILVEVEQVALRNGSEIKPEWTDGTVDPAR